MRANRISVRMALERDWVLLSLLLVGLSPLGRGAALKDGTSRSSLNVLNMNKQRIRILGSPAEDEKPLRSKVRAGKLIIGLNESAHEGLNAGSGSPHESGYQSDQADWSELQHLQGSVYGFGAPNSPAVQQLLGMRPKVECAEDSMRLKVHGGIAAFGFGLLIDRGSVPPLPFSRVPLECGLQIQKRWRDLDFIVPYDGCYVSQERDAYIIPIRLWGLSARLSCPLLNLASPSPPSVSCYPNGMIVRTQNVAPVEDLWVKVENEWQPLLKASPKCGYSIVSHPEGVVVSAPYKPCMEVKDELYSLHMAAKTEFRLFCPSLVPSLPLNLSSPLAPNVSDSLDGAPVTLLPTDASPRPTQQPTGWQWFGRPYPNQRPGSLPWPTGVPSAATSATPQNVPEMRYPQFPETWYPPYPRLTPAPPVLPQKPKPVPVTHTSTSGTSPLAPSFERFDGLGYPPPQVPWQSRLPVLEAVPTPVPSERDLMFPFLYSGDHGPMKPHESLFAPAPQPYLPQYPQRPVTFPTAEPLEASSVLGLTGQHWPPSQGLSESGFAQRPQWPYPAQYPQSPAVSPTAASPFEASSVLGLTGYHWAPSPMPPDLGFAQGPQGPLWSHPAQYPQSPAVSHTAGSSFEASSVLGLTGYHWAPSPMPPVSSFAQGPPWSYPPQYPQRPAVSPTAAPPFQESMSNVLGAAGSSYQDVPQTSKPLGYSQCCLSPAMYSNCCPPSVTYHQHNHHHFGFPYPVFNRGATSRSTRNLTSKAFSHFAHGGHAHGGHAHKPAASQNRGNHARLFGALQLQDKIQQAAAKPLGSTFPSSHPFSRLMKPTVRPRTAPSSSIPSTKPFLAGQVPPLPLLPSSLHNTPDAIPFAHLGSRDKPEPGSTRYFGELGAEYSRTRPQVPLQNAGPNHVEERSRQSPSTLGRTDSGPYMFLPHESSQQIYRAPVNNLSPVYNKPPSDFSRDPSAQTVHDGFDTRQEQQKQNLSLLERRPSLSQQPRGPELPVQPSAYSQGQVPSVLGGQSNAIPSSDQVTQASSMPLLQVLAGPFSKHWVPVVPPKKTEQAEFVGPRSRRPPPNYRPHGSV